MGEKPKTFEKVDFRKLRPYMYMPSRRITTINQNQGPIIVLEGMESEYKAFKKENLKEALL